MYWPVGTTRIYATSSTSTSTSGQPFHHVVSNDGLPLSTIEEKDKEKEADRSEQASMLTADSASTLDFPVPTPVPATPTTPNPPNTPGINPVEHELLDTASETSIGIPLHEPIIALRVARVGHVFAVITATSMTIWRAKVRQISAPLPRLPFLSLFFSFRRLVHLVPKNKKCG